MMPKAKNRFWICIALHYGALDSNPGPQNMPSCTVIFN